MTASGSAATRPAGTSTRHGPAADGGGARTPARDPVTGAVAFAAALRGAGMPVGPDRVQRFVEALGHLDPRSRGDVYWAGRTTLCAHPEHVTRYDNVFAAFFDGRVADLRRSPQLPARPTAGFAVPSTTPGHAPDPEDDDRSALVANASSAEVLRRRDVASLDPTERRQLERLLARFAMPGAQRRTRRWERDRGGAVDRGRTVRALLRNGGEARLRHRTARHRPRRVVLLVDVSGSMTPYADALLRFAHAAARGRQRTEVFSIGTRLTRLTRELTHRDADTAMAAVAAAIPDWSGGTRLGAQLKVFLDRWGQRGMARGAVVVIMSDGWERDDPTVLGEQMARLHRVRTRCARKITICAEIYRYKRG